MRQQEVQPGQRLSDVFRPGCRLRDQEAAEVTGPPWPADVLAAAMILTAGYSASRLAISRALRAATEADTDGLHALMGTAMAGMFLPQLRLLPSSAWAVVLGMAAVWFAGSAVPAGGRRRAAGNASSRFRTSWNASPWCTCSWPCPPHSACREWPCPEWALPPLRQSASQCLR
jgi:hypothetical protein